MELKYENFAVEVDKERLKQSLFVCVSGSHSFGWVTKKSDLDIRFVMMTPIGNLISPFFKYKTVQDLKQNVDITYYPIEQFLILLAKGNGNAVDNLFEPKLYSKENTVVDLQDIVRDNIHKGFVEHCLGYSTHILKDIKNETRLKKYGVEKLLLCRYRAVIQGFNLLLHRIDYNLPRLFKTCATQYGESILNLYINGGTLDNKYINLALEETTKIHDYVYKSLLKSSMKSKLDSSLITELDYWIKEQYLKSAYYEI
jgi:predicted nucleotidyltransferase